MMRLLMLLAPQATVAELETDATPYEEEGTIGWRGSPPSCTGTRCACGVVGQKFHKRVQDGRSSDEHSGRRGLEDGHDANQARVEGNTGLW